MGFLSAGESIDRMATYCRVEQLFFGLLGGWVTEVHEPTAKLALLGAADHCAWRALRWFEMLPTAPPGPDALIASVESELAAVATIADVTGEAPAARMVMAYEGLLPALVAVLRAHLAETTAVADAPVQRMLEIAIADVDRDLRAAIDPVERVVSGPDGGREAERIRAAIASDTAGIGRLLGV